MMPALGLALVTDKMRQFEWVSRLVIENLPSGPPQYQSKPQIKAALIPG